MLRGLILLAVLGLGAASPGATRFENRTFGHTVAVPVGWVAQLSPGDRSTTVASYRVRRLDRRERPPRGHVRVTLHDYGRAACPRDATRPGEPIRLVGPAQFEGFHGYSAVWCLGGHSLQAFVLDGAAVAPARLEQARRVIASLRLTPRAHAAGNERSMRVLGRTVERRPVRAFRMGNPRSPRRLLVVGCIHGDECAGMAVTQRLIDLTRPVAVDLWIVQNLNPDGLARGTRGNARGVDLNRDFGRFTQPESRLARELIRRVRPQVSIWFHQPQAVVRAWGRSRAIARRYARLAGEPYRSIAWPPGSASRWQNGLGQTSFVVELPAGPLAHDRALRHAGAILALVGE